MHNNNFDGRTASFKVSEFSTNFGKGNDRYFSNLEDARKYMEKNRPMAEFRFGSDFWLYRKSGNTWVPVERLGNHFV